jgi:hypothetical protein
MYPILTSCVRRGDGEPRSSRQTWSKFQSRNQLSLFWTLFWTDFLFLVEMLLPPPHFPTRHPSPSSFLLLLYENKGLTMLHDWYKLCTMNSYTVWFLYQFVHFLCDFCTNSYIFYKLWARSPPFSYYYLKIRGWLCCMDEFVQSHFSDVVLLFFCTVYK